MAEKLLHRHVYSFNPKDNGGEQLTLVTSMFSNGDIEEGLAGEDGGIFWNQELTLHSYCNSASFNLVGTAIGPDDLRALADELEEIETLTREKLIQSREAKQQAATQQGE